MSLFIKLNWIRLITKIMRIHKFCEIFCVCICMFLSSSRYFMKMLSRKTEYATIFYNLLQIILAHSVFFQDKSILPVTPSKEAMILTKLEKISKLRTKASLFLLSYMVPARVPGKIKLGCHFIMS
jgi:hypothetical protein